MKSDQTLIRKNHMEQLHFITKLLNLKDPNITILDVVNQEILAELDYPAPLCPFCSGQMAKCDFQKASKIPYLEVAGYKVLIRLKKRRFRCTDCWKVRGAETPLVKKNHQISEVINQKISLTAIAEQLSVSTSTVIQNHFLRYTREVRGQVKVITMDMVSPYYHLAQSLFPNAKIVLD